MEIWWHDSLDFMFLNFFSLFLSFFFFLIFGYTEGDGTPLQYSCLENPMDGGAC